MNYNSDGEHFGAHTWSYFGSNWNNLGSNQSFLYWSRVLYWSLLTILYYLCLFLYIHIQSNEFDDIQINRQINVFWSCQKPGLSLDSNSLFLFKTEKSNISKNSICQKRIYKWVLKCNSHWIFILMIEFKITLMHDFFLFIKRLRVGEIQW